MTTIEAMNDALTSPTGDVGIDTAMIDAAPVRAGDVDPVPIGDPDDDDGYLEDDDDDDAEDDEDDDEEPLQCAGRAVA